MKIQNLAVISGDQTTIKKGTITYEPTFNKTQSKGEKTNPQSAFIRSDINFSQGILKLKFKIEHEDTGVLIRWEENNKLLSSAGLSYVTKSFLINDDINDHIESAGSTKNLDKNQEIALKIEIIGSKCRLYVNNILFCENNISIKSTPLNLRITSLGKVVIYDIELDTNKPKLFVVMQFSDEYNKLYEEVILPISEKMGFDCVRADEFFTSTPILKDIISSIEEASAIIAEITPDNPNVFYEIGYSHAINKPTILLCDRKREKLPFDISGFRTLFYENSIAGKSKIEKSLNKYLENII